MSGTLDMRSLPVGTALVIIIGSGTIVVLLGAIGYSITNRKVKQPFLRFLTRYGAWFGVLLLLELALVALLPSVHATIQSFTATLIGRVLTMAGVSHGISGSTIVLQNPYLAFDITAGCLGGVLYWAYIALVMAESEASIKQRLTGVFTGLVILFAFNFLRLILSIYVEWLTGVSIHGYFYIFNMIFVLLVWFGWLWTIRRGRARFIRSMA